MNTFRLRREQQFQEATIYPVITPEFCRGNNPLKVIRSLLAAGAKVIQLRVKKQPDAFFYELALQVRKITLDAGCLMIINDRPDIAQAVRSDGIHLGQDDLPVALVRRMLPDAIIGLSTHNREEILAAQQEDVSVINIGPIYATSTKVNPMAPLGLDALRELIPLVRVPFSVMGGIKEHHLPELVSAGVRCVAMVTQLTRDPRPGDVFTRMHRVIKP
ncbi:thiamine phosphate synthase [Myxococcota bacterium]|nr:thiamine phosphate synthase [Myxococcota bacterium]